MRCKLLKRLTYNRSRVMYRVSKKEGGFNVRIKVIEPLARNMKEDKLKVCAYARVSTDSLRQEDSFENQKSTYKRTITSNPIYEFVGVYADQGISGCSENRPGFQKMIEDAREGKIDLIITKSVSRFARNTVTVLKVARELKELGVGIFFEEQNINTLSGDGELMLSVLASFAQEESRSMSENLKWAVRNKFKRGEVVINAKRFMGYDKNESGELIINDEEAKIVKRIFKLYLEGTGTFKIAKLLDQEKIKTVAGGRWRDNTINEILRNEKYKGDCILQKYRAPDNIMNRTVKNNGEVQSYYITDNHPGIISRDDWTRAQGIMRENKEKRKIGENGVEKYANRYPLSGMLLCPHCGKKLKRTIGYKGRIEYRCSTYVTEGKKACPGVKALHSELMKKNITEPTVIEEVIINGEKHYRYTSKAEFYRDDRSTAKTKSTQNGSVLPSINRPRRTAIKL